MAQLVNHGALLRRDQQQQQTQRFKYVFHSNEGELAIGPEPYQIRQPFAAGRSDCLERRREIRDEIIGRFDTDRNSNQGIGYSQAIARLLW